MKADYLIAIFITLFVSNVFPQEVIVDTDRGIRVREIKKDLNGDVIIAVEFIGEGFFLKGGLIKVTENLDTTIFVIDDTLNKVNIQDLLITKNNKYIVSATERIVGDTCGGVFNRYSFFVYDENFNLLDFKRYMTPVTCVKQPIVLSQRDDGRIFGMSIEPNYTFIMEINEQGDTLRTFFSNADSTKGYRTRLLKSNKGNVAFYTFLDKFYENPDKWTVVTVDTSLNFTFTPVFYSNSKKPRYIRANWLNDSIYVIGCDIGVPGGKAYHGDIFVFEANANQNHQDLGTFVHFDRPDTTDQIVFNAPTYTNQSNIFVGSWRASNPGASYNGRYMVGLVDENMNMKGMKSLGKNGYQYDMMGMQATDDGGCIVAGTVHDNANAPEYDFDLFIRKIDPGLIVGAAENTTDPYDSDYSIYPNPGNSELHIFSIHKSDIEILSLQGTKIAKKHLKANEDNIIDMWKFPSGVYLLRLTDEKGHSEILKWEKL